MQVGAHHFLHVITCESLVSQPNSIAGFLSRRTSACRRWSSLGALLQFLDSLVEANLAKVIKCGWLKVLNLAVQRAFEEGLGFPKLPFPQLSGASIEKLSRSRRGRCLGNGIG